MDQATLVCRTGQGVSTSAAPSSQLSETGLLGQAGAGSSASLSPPKTGRYALIWGAGSTILSVVGFLGYMMFEQYNNSLSELRTDLKHFNETTSSFVQREQFNKCRDQMREHLKEVRAVNTARAQLEHELQLSEKAREEMVQELQRIRERLAYVEGHQVGTQNTPNPRK
jgi:hypothetical protein